MLQFSPKAIKQPLNYTIKKIKAVLSLFDELDIFFNSPCCVEDV